MKLSYLQGKAATIAGLEVDRAMSVFQITGPIAGIREIKVGPIKGGPIGPAERTCTVKVIFGEDLYTEIAFEGELIYFGFEGEPLYDKSPYIHWRVNRVATHYHRYEPFVSERTY